MNRSFAQAGTRSVVLEQSDGVISSLPVSTSLEFTAPDKSVGIM